MLNLRSAVALSIGLVAVGCSSPPEEAVLGQFFAAARLRDNTALASFATIMFEPHIDGIVTEFHVIHVTTERRTAFARLAAGQVRDEAKANDLILQLSINIRPDVDITKYDGQLGLKDLTIEAPVKLPDGGIVQRTLIATIQHAVLKADPEIVGRWIVTDLRVSSDSPKPEATFRGVINPPLLTDSTLVSSGCQFGQVGVTSCVVPLWRGTACRIS